MPRTFFVLWGFEADDGNLLILKPTWEEYVVDTVRNAFDGRDGECSLEIGRYVDAIF